MGPVGGASTPATRDDTSGPSRLLVPLAMVLVTAVLFAYAYVGAPIVPMWDGWTWIAHAKAVDEGGIAQLVRDEHPLWHAQHLYLLPSIIALIVGPMFDYSFRPLAFLCVLVLVACAVFFYRLARRHGLNRLEAFAVFLCVASLRHNENMLSGFQLGFPICMLLGSAAVVIADERRDRRGLVTALILAAGSVLSSTGGIFALVMVLLVRWFDPKRWRNWLLFAVVLPAVFFFLLHLLFTQLGMMQRSVVAFVVARLEPTKLPIIFEDFVRAVGGGLVSGDTSTFLGLCLIAGAAAMVVNQIRRTARLDALAGLTLFSLAATATIAVARSPIGPPCSRYAIFATPVACVCAIGLLQLVRSRGSEWMLACGSALAVGFAWLFVDSVRDANSYRGLIDTSDLEVRSYLARMSAGETLTRKEIGAVNPGPPRLILGLMQFTEKRGLTIFSPDYKGFEVHRELPSRAFQSATAVMEDGALRVAGLGYMYNSYPCKFPSGCRATLLADIQVTGRATIGILVRRADGTEKDNYNIELTPGDEFAPQTVHAYALEGETLEPYFFSFSPDDVVRVKSSSFVMLQKSAIP